MEKEKCTFKIERGVIKKVRFSISMRKVREELQKNTHTECTKSMTKTFICEVIRNVINIVLNKINPVIKVGTNIFIKNGNVELELVSRLTEINQNEWKNKEYDKIVNDYFKMCTNIMNNICHTYRKYRDCINEKDFVEVIKQELTKNNNKSNNNLFAEKVNEENNVFYMLDIDCSSSGVNEKKIKVLTDYIKEKLKRELKIKNNNDEIPMGDAYLIRFKIMDENGKDIENISNICNEIIKDSNLFFNLVNNKEYEDLLNNKNISYLIEEKRLLQALQIQIGNNIKIKNKL